MPKKKNTVKDMPTSKKKVKGVSRVGRKYPRYFYENDYVFKMYFSGKGFHMFVYGEVANDIRQIQSFIFGVFFHVDG